MPPHCMKFLRTKAEGCTSVARWLEIHDMSPKDRVRQLRNFFVEVCATHCSFAEVCVRISFGISLILYPISTLGTCYMPAGKMITFITCIFCLNVMIVSVQKQCSSCTRNLELDYKRNMYLKI